ncbi:Protein ERGIC-53, partial [Chytriomyces hyalinus]
PLIYAIVNDGNKEVNGRTDYLQSAAGSCLRDYRNTAHAVWVRVTYKKRQLRVDVDLYKDGYQFIECFRAKDIDLPPGYFFGVSASTGQTMHDDHDILGLEVFEVNPHPRKSKSKFQDEYKISNDVKQSFEEAKKAIEDVEHDLNAEQTYEGSEAETFNPAIVQHLQENQFKIIEALNVLEQKVINSPQIAATNSHEKASAGVASAVAPVDAKVEAIRSKIDELEDKLVTLDRDIKELFNVIRTGNSQGQMKMSEVARKLDESHNKIKSAHDAIASSQGKGGAGVGSIAMYGLFFMVGGVDGVDLDWEYPGGNNGLSCNLQRLNDVDNFVLLLQQLRLKLGDDRLISIAVSTSVTPYGRTFISYDDPTSILAKSKWSKANGFGGVTVWEIS